MGFPPIPNFPAAAPAASLGIHFNQPSQFQPIIAPVADLNVFDNGNIIQDSSTTAFFTQMASRGLQDTTNWTANTYKTLLTVTGAGFVAGIVGPTAGGTQTTTFEITTDGILDEIAITVAASQRAVLLAKYGGSTDFTTAEIFMYAGVSAALGADKATFTISSNPVGVIPGWRQMAIVPQLRFTRSLLIRAKHSASITNSTATAYSAVMYRLDL